MKQRYYYFIFSVFTLCFFSVGNGQSANGKQISTGTSQSKQFQSRYYEAYDLIGKAKETQWVIFNYDVIGNTDKYYYIGYTDYIDLNFNPEGEISLARLLSKSIKAYQAPADGNIKNIVYEKKPVKLVESSSLEDLHINYLNYSKYIDHAGRLIAEDDYFIYSYNQYGDLQEYILKPVIKEDQKRYFKFEYQYDTNGNWLERLLYEVDGKASEKEMIQKITRKIIYY